jgi:hypothetical protein
MYSSKVAKRELLSLKEIMKVDIENLHIPLMAVIDYKGYRVCCQGELISFLHFLIIFFFYTT